jgi:hypothetical protein
VKCFLRILRLGAASWRPRYIRAPFGRRLPSGATFCPWGIFYFVSSVMALSANIATGELWKHFGARIPFYSSAGLAALAALLVTTGAPETRKN